MARNPKHYAIVIGIDSYKQLPPLRTAVNDATRFAEWLKHDDGGGLPPENIKLVVSPPTPADNSLEARPTQYDIDNALYEMGVGRGELIGQRLYFYFAGHAVGTNFDDIAMLMAPATLDRLGHNIGLRAYRQFFREAGLFEEIVFVLDCSRDTAPTSVRGSEPSLTLSTESKINVCDFLLLAATAGEKAFVMPVSNAGERAGLLTRATLEGLKGEAADNSGRVTSTSLSSYVQRRVSELANIARFTQMPEFILPIREIVFAENKFNEKDTSEIIVEVPHWSAVVTIYDNSMRPVLVLNQAQEKSGAPGKYFVTGKLLKGIYLIEVTLEGKSQSELRVVFPDQTTVIPKSTWKKLKFVSPAPLGGKEKRRKLHAEKASEHSHHPTWQKPGGNLSSRLFLFVRTSEPQRYPLFHTGLSLKRLNEETDAITGQIRYSEEIITEFTDDAVEIDKANGWMAFCADLEPGFYILQKYRPPHINKPRQQPIYLCADWETQVFMSARNSPSLRKLTLSMANLGAGFNPDDETAEAAEAVLDAIRQDSGSSKQLVTGEKITALLKSESKNPWLGILAAYALRPQLLGDEKSEDLFDEIIEFLQSTIGDHPDVRALNLIKMRREATASETTETIVFKEPPLLRAGFKIVQEQALKISKTIPLGSLTERLSGKILTNSPWTAWRELNLQELSEKNISHPQSITPVLIQAGAYLQSISPRAPVIRLSSLELGVETTHQPASDTSNFESLSLSLPPVTTQEASLIKLVQDLTQTGDLDALEETYTLDSSCVDDLLNNVNAEEISAASGVPLARTEEGLQSLREKHKTQVASGYTEEISQTPVENLVLGYALQKSSAVSEMTDIISLGAPFDSLESDFESLPMDDISTTAQTVESAAPPVTIEECVAKLKAEAARLVLPWAKTGKAATKTPPDEEYREKGKDIAERLYVVAELILASAAFTATTDVQGQVTYGNGAFIELITPRRISFDEDEQKLFCEKNKRLFGAALNAAPLGTSTFSNPVPESIYRAFKLQRSEIKEGSTQSVQAYLNVLRVKDASSVNTEALKKIDSGLSDLRLYASLFAHSTSESREEYYKKLVELVKKFQQAALENGETNNINITTSSLNQEDTMIDDTVNEAAFSESEETELTQPEGTLYGREFWGISRHELIAGAAMELLSNRARLEVRRILAPIGVFGLEDVAGWADRLKQNISNPDEETAAFLNDNRNRTHGTWHFVNVPHGADGYSRTDYPQFTRDDDVVQMIKHSVLVLKGESDRFSELNALRWLAHLVGDVHQPVHVGCGYIDESSDPPRLVSDPQEAAGLDHDRGGNQIQLPVRATLHSYWDSRILDDADDHFHDEDAPESEAASPASDAPADDSNADSELKKRFIEKLVGRIKNAALTESDAPARDVASDTSGLAPENWAEVWATESIRLARQAYQSLEITDKQGSKFKVRWEGKDDYDARCKPIAQQQVDAAAQNLAAVLNAIWAEN